MRRAIQFPIMPNKPTTIRLNEKNKAAFQRAAKADGRSLTSWMVQQCLAALFVRAARGNGKEKNQ